MNVPLHISPSSAYGSAYTDSHNHILTLRFSYVFLCSLGRLWERSLSLLCIRGIVSSESSRSWYCGGEVNCDWDCGRVVFLQLGLLGKLQPFYNAFLSELWEVW